MEALVSCGVPREKIEQHKSPKKIMDYENNHTKYRYQDTKDERFKSGDQAHVIVRRETLGGASNDFGVYLDPTGGSVVFLCDYNRRSTGWNDSWLARVKQEYSFQVVKKTYEARGKKVERVQDGKKIRVFVGV